MSKPEGVSIGEIDREAFVTEFLSRQGSDSTNAYMRGNVPRSGLLPDWAIREFVTCKPFVDYGECPKGVVSYGLTSAGYDLRVGYKFKVFTNAKCATVDPKNMDPGGFVDFDLSTEPHEWDRRFANMREPRWFECTHCHKGDNREIRELDDLLKREPCPALAKSDHILIPPNCFALAETIETLYIPRNVCCWCIGKSTYARCGINMNFTPFEPGWWGVVTVEIINATPLPVKIYAGEGIGQAQFFLMAGTPEKGYGDKANAKYQGQSGLTLPTVR